MIASFNPRAHVGRDLSRRKTAVEVKVSIHAPTWGATSADKAIECLVDVSIHAPTWGATAFNNIADAIRHVSIHAPTWGATAGRLTTGRR